MFAPINRKAIEKRSANAIPSRLLRQTFAITLGVSISTVAMSREATAQFASGDLPASPWSNQKEMLSTRDNQEGSRSQSKRLRQPALDSPASKDPHQNVSAGRVIELGSNNHSRPAPVTLMGPKLPLSSMQESSSSQESRPERIQSTPFGRLQEFSPMDVPSQQVSSSDVFTAAPSHALTQKTPIAAQSDWQRLPAGGQVYALEPVADAVKLELERNRYRDQNTLNGRGAIALGLPDRVETKANSVVPSQMASTASTLDRDEPMQLHATSRPGRTEAPSSEFKSLSESSSSRLQQAPSNTANGIAEPRKQQSPRPAQVQSSDKSPIVFPSSNAFDAGLENRAMEMDLAQARSPELESRVDETQMKRIALAERVSHELLSSSTADFAGAPQVLEALPGWQAIERELRQRLDRCDALLKRGAVLSAREEASEGLLRLFRTMDLHRGKMFSESAFERATTALREELDFQKTLGGRRSSGVQSIVNTHSTEALRNRPLDSTSPEMAAMHYRWYARFQLIEASNGHPWAADLLYAYGRTIEKEAELNVSKANQFRGQAVVFYQAATQVKPSHSEAASQLGFALIHLDRLEDAYAALSNSIHHKPSANAWNNLAEVFRRRGATTEAEYAVEQATTFSQSVPLFSPENPEIIDVDPATFAKYSPMPTMAYPAQNNGPGNRYGNANANDMNVRSAKSGNSFLSKIFR